MIIAVAYDLVTTNIIIPGTMAMLAQASYLSAPKSTRIVFTHGQRSRARLGASVFARLLLAGSSVRVEKSAVQSRNCRRQFVWTGGRRKLGDTEAATYVFRIARLHMHTRA